MNLQDIVEIVESVFNENELINYNKYFINRSEKQNIPQKIHELTSLNLVVKVSSSGIYSMAMKIHKEISFVLLPILKTELSYLERTGILTGSNSGDKDYLIESISSEIFIKYKQLENTICKIIEKNISSYELLLTRLSCDFLNIRNDFKIEFGNIIDELIFLGDSHSYGGGVTLIKLNDGELVYKPHDINCEMFFKNLMSIVKEKTIRVIACNDYGWVQYIRHSPPHTNNKSFFNLGKLQAITYSVMLKDLHQSNVCFDEDMFFVLDAECLFSSPCDLLGLGFYTNNNIYDYLIVPRESTSDRVNLRRLSPLANLLDSSVKTQESIQSHIGSFIFGFISMYIEILRNKEVVINLVNNSLFDVKTRVVIRVTEFYYGVLQDLYHPRVMMLSDSKKVDFLRDKLYCSHIPPDIINSEIRYLLDGNIPYYFHDGAIGGISDYYGNHFSLPRENYKNHLTSSFISYELGLDDMKKQVNLITIILDSELQNLLFKRVNNDV